MPGKKRKQPTTTFKTEDGGLTLCVNYAFKTRMDALVWRSYIQPSFFNRLLAASTKRVNLEKFLQGRGFTNFKRGDLDKLTKSLRRKYTKGNAVTLMRGLHKYTDPKLIISSQWVEW